MKELCFSVFALIIGLSAFSQKKWMHFTTENSSLPVNYVFDVDLDSFSNAWMGTGMAYTELGGLAYFDKNDNLWLAYTDYIEYPWFGCYYIHEIEIDKQGRIWMLTEQSSGGMIFQGDSFFWADNFESFGIAYELFDDPLGGMWIGCGGGFQYSDSSYCIWNRIDTLNTPLGRISASNGMFVSRKDDSTMILGISAGAFEYNTKTDSAFCIPIINSCTNILNIRNILLSASDKDWFASHNGGLFVHSIVDNTWEIFSNYFYPNPFPDINVSDLVSDNKGNVWVSTYNMGLIKYNNSEGYTQINIYNDSLPSNAVYDMEVDEFNNIWMGTGYGLVIYNEDGISFKAEPADSVFDVCCNVFPNPTTTGVSIQFEKDPNDYTIELFSLEGQLIQKYEPYENPTQIDFSSFQKGMYLILIRNKTTNKLYHEKIIKT